MAIRMWIKAALQLIVVFFCYHLHLGAIKAQVISWPPESTTAALGTNATFSYRGTGSVLWQINSTPVVDASQVPLFSSICMFAPLPNDSISELIVTASTTTNASLVIVCVVEPGRGVQPWSSIKSSPVQLLVYAEPNPPEDLNITVEGLILVAIWSKPFSLKGEELSYIITIMNTANGVQEEATVSSTKYTFSVDEPVRERDCAEYMFTVFSNNSFSKSSTGVSDYDNIPTAYPIESYVFIISEYSGYVTTTINHTGNTSLNNSGSNHGLLYNQVYHLMIEALNAIGSTSSEKTVLYTTGLQSSTAVVELNGNITVTCIFATGASSTGCQVVRNFKVHGLINYSTLVVQAVEILNGEGIGNITINVTIFFPSIIPPVQDPAEGGGSILPWVLGVVVTVGVGIVLVIALILIYKFCCRIPSSSSYKTNTELVPDYEMTQNNTYGINVNIETIPNAVYGVGQRSEQLVQEVYSKPDGVYEYVI